MSILCIFSLLTNLALYNKNKYWHQEDDLAFQLQVNHAHTSLHETNRITQELIQDWNIKSDQEIARDLSRVAMTLRAAEEDIWLTQHYLQLSIYGEKQVVSGEQFSYLIGIYSREVFSHSVIVYDAAQKRKIQTLLPSLSEDLKTIEQTLIEQWTPETDYHLINEGWNNMLPSLKSEHLVKLYRP